LAAGLAAIPLTRDVRKRAAASWIGSLAGAGLGMAAGHVIGRSQVPPCPDVAAPGKVSPRSSVAFMHIQRPVSDCEDTRQTCEIGGAVAGGVAGGIAGALIPLALRKSDPSRNELWLFVTVPLGILLGTELGWLGGAAIAPACPRPSSAL
jgi:hypothetical protein